MAIRKTEELGLTELGNVKCLTIQIYLNYSYNYISWSLNLLA